MWLPPPTLLSLRLLRVSDVALGSLFVLLACVDRVHNFLFLYLFFIFNVRVTEDFVYVFTVHDYLLFFLAFKIN